MTNNDKKEKAENFLKVLGSMTPEEMAQYISNNGKGPKVIQLVSWVSPDMLENNTAITNV